MMQRREFLKRQLGWLGAATGAIALAEAGPAAMRSGRPMRILVLGAGVSGLAAARALTAAGQEVRVLEARDRIGGRIWTSAQWAEMPLDLGASWIHRMHGNPITTLMRASGAAWGVTDYENAVAYDAGGGVLSPVRNAQLETMRAAVRAALLLAQERDPDVSVHQALASLRNRWRNEPGARQLLHYVVSGEIEHEYAGSAESLSAHWFDSGAEFEGPDAILLRGMRGIVDELARGLNIHFSQVVRELDWTGPELRVQTDRERFSADRVLLTFPLGVLKRGGVRFIPTLPPCKHRAIEGLGMGVLNKCYLRFPHVFWPDQVDWMGHVSAEHGLWNEWVSFQRVAGWPVLLGFNAADRARDMEELSDEATVASAMQTLHTIFGRRIPDPVDWQVTRWARDPFALGSYSYNALGSTPAMRKELARPEQLKLFFAGEACHSEYFGTVHGAYLSGLEAAGQMLNR